MDLVGGCPHPRDSLVGGVGALPVVDVQAAQARQTRMQRSHGLHYVV